ncbi:hypothetical protein HELRODRAFT_169961 [Helobdella robusta]|uniref:Tetraspanin n=1 Tax=Helobdella robusta TaxID=6412 RepID=T1F2H4_HELRO|nr:hypothetical protein HELRODRAFT_169961 [Helobdella robusta]ESO08222.1 hypothetical protein HELRODRAFT_169961 [Helobdella robusta]
MGDEKDDDGGGSEGEEQPNVQIVSNLPVNENEEDDGEPKKTYKIHSAEDFNKIIKTPVALEKYYGKMEKKASKFERKDKPDEEDRKHRKESRDIAAELKQDESWPFFLLSFINLAICAGNSYGLHILTRKHRRYVAYLSLLEGYDGGGFEYQIFYVMFSTAVVSAMGFLITNGKLFGSAKGLLRYMIYIYVGWSSAMLVVLVGTLGVTYLLTFVTEDLFQKDCPFIVKRGNKLKGYRQAMLKFSTSLTIQRAIHKMHNVFKCCGFLNYSEWLEMTWSDKISRMDLGLPKSCCLPEAGSQCVHLVTKQNTDKLTPIKVGCKAKLTSIMSKFLWRVIVFVGGSAIAIVLCIIVSMLSVKVIRDIDKLILEEKSRQMAIKWLMQKQKEEEEAMREKAERQRRQLEEFNRAKAAAAKARADRIAALKIKMEKENQNKALHDQVKQSQNITKTQEAELGLSTLAPRSPTAAPGDSSSITAGLESMPGMSILPGASKLLGALKKLG